MSHAPNDDLDLVEILPWIEFCAWSGLVVTPTIWWLQGSSVSNDQFVVRTSMVVVSAIAAIGLRIRAILANRNVVNNCQGNSAPTEPPRQGEPE